MTIEIIKKKLDKIKNQEEFVSFLQHLLDNYSLYRYDIIESFNDYRSEKDFHLDFYINNEKEMLYPDDSFYKEYWLIQSKFIELCYHKKITSEIVITPQNFNYHSFIGKNVVKKSGKPFKSNEKVGMVVDITINPHTNKKAFLMNDDSIVDCHVVKLI